MITVSLIVPTAGRESLAKMLASCVGQDWTPDDRILVRGDGPQPIAAQICRRYVTLHPNLPILYTEGTKTGAWGNRQRQEAMEMARTTHLQFLDDDDELMPDAIKKVKSRALWNPHRIWMFQLLTKYDTVVWARSYLERRNVSSQNILLPNVPERLPRWRGDDKDGDYTADYDFIRDAVEKYPDKELGVRWVGEIIARQQKEGDEKAGI